MKQSALKKSKENQFKGGQSILPGFEIEKGDIQWMSERSGTSYHHFYSWWKGNYADELKIKNYRQMRAAFYMLVARRTEFDWLERSFKQWINDNDREAKKCALCSA